MSAQELGNADLLASARDAAVIAGKHTGDAESGRRLAPEAVAAVVGAGFARHFVPARWSGHAGGFEEVLEATAVVGEVCPSTAWFASLTAALGRMAAYLPPAGQSEIWSRSPNPVIVGALMPLGSATPVPGGWRLDGRWPYVSGIDFSDWALVCATVRGGDQPADTRFFAVPRSAYSIIDTWFNIGMRATGSNTLAIENHFVPTALSFTRDDLSVGEAPEAAAACHRAPLRAANGLSFAAPVLGCARGALSAWQTWRTEKNGGDPIVGEPAVAAVLARATGEIDCAALLLRRVATVLDRGQVTPRETARNWRDSAIAAELAKGAVDRLFGAAGTSGQSESSILQRFWRDAHVAASHVVLRFDAAAVAFAAAGL